MAKTKNATPAFILTFNVDSLKQAIGQHALSTAKPAETHVGVSALIGFYVGKGTGAVTIESNNLSLGQSSKLHADVDIVSMESMESDVVWPFGLSYTDLATFLNVCRGDNVQITVSFEPVKPSANEDDEEYPSPIQATLHCGTLTISVPAYNPSTMIAVAKTYTSEPTIMTTEDAILIASMIANFTSSPSDPGMPDFMQGIFLRVQPNKVDGGMKFSALATDTRSGATYDRAATEGSEPFKEYISPILFSAIAKAVASGLIDGDIELGQNNHLVVAKSDKLTLCVNTFNTEHVLDLTHFTDKTYARLHAKGGVTELPQSQQIAVNRDALKQALKAFGLAVKDTKQVFVRWEVRQPDPDSDAIVLRLSNSNARNVDVGVEIDGRLLSDEVSCNEDGCFAVEFDYSQLNNAIGNTIGETIVMTNAPFPRHAPDNAYHMILESDNDQSLWKICVVEYRLR